MSVLKLIPVLFSCIILCTNFIAEAAPADTSQPVPIRGIALDSIREIYPQEPPQPLTRYTQAQPASLHPTLRWGKVQGAVSYEVQIQRPQKKLLTAQNNFVTGCNLSLPPDTAGTATWRVRALDFDQKPLTAYSAAEELFVDPRQQEPLYPEPLSKFNTGNGTTLLYPVYNWIPLAGAAAYDVEILSTPEVLPDQPAPADKVVGRGVSHWFDWYDDTARLSSGTLYWRVRARDSQNQPLGIFCPPQPMRIDPAKPYVTGTLGDSITHGGGDLSYSPSDWEYSYQYYLRFDTVNLGQSGDTSAMTRERFERDVLPFHLKYLIVMTGSNSLRGWTSAEEVIGDLAAIEEKCRQHGIKAVFLTLPPINPKNIKKTFNEPTIDGWQDRFRKVNAWIRQRRHIDLAAKIRDDQELPYELGIDGLHLNDIGKKLMAEAINEQWAEAIST